MTTMSFKDKWLEAVARKNSLLCVGIDPAEFGQRSGNTLRKGQSKLEYCIQVIEQVAPYCAAIKPNRQYLRDFSRKDFQTLTACIHDHNMVAIDDSKIADIGDTNNSAFYHSALEGFDAITYAPFPGNIAPAILSAHEQGIAIITLVLMSNPEYRVIKSARIESQLAWQYFAQKVSEFQGDAVVLGAPSPSNHITMDEVQKLKEILGEQLILVPGIGAQGGDIGPIKAAFGQRTIANVGRAIFYATNPAAEAAKYAKRLKAHD